MGYTEKELQEMLKNDQIEIVDDGRPKKREPIPVPDDFLPTSGKSKRKHKYNAKKLIIDGITFPSKKEGNVYLKLKAMERAGEIYDIEMQVEYELQPAFTYRGKRIRAIKIIPDFRFKETKTGDTVIVDAKGGTATQTQSFKNKWKMLKYKYMNDLSVKFEIW